MRSTIAIDVAAPPELVFGLARDVERWPSLLPHYVAVRVERRGPDGDVAARFVARRVVVSSLGIGFPVAWRSRAWSEPETLGLRFSHRGGATDGMEVAWRIDRTEGGCRVSIEHDFRPRFRPWAVIADRLVVRPIASRTLASFKAIAEAIAP
jgi:ribosome-associated toxin RatA of RatAB toxin-antitoxin module